MTDSNSVIDLKIAKSIVSLARTMGDDLPDGMADELLEAWEDYKVTKDNEDFIFQVKDICMSWGFPFG